MTRFQCSKYNYPSHTRLRSNYCTVCVECEVFNKTIAFTKKRHTSWLKISDTRQQKLVTECVGTDAHPKIRVVSVERYDKIGER